MAEFHSWFSDEESCLAFIERLRWPEGFVCSSCAAMGEPLRIRRGRLRCRSCRAETSATAGTIFADTKLPLTTWFQTIWLVTNQKHGTSVLDLQRAIGMSYETAWRERGAPSASAGISLGRGRTLDAPSSKLSPAGERRWWPFEPCPAKARRSSPGFAFFPRSGE